MEFASLSLIHLVLYGSVALKIREGAGILFARLMNSLKGNIVAVESAPLGRRWTGIYKVKFLRGRNRLVSSLGQ